MFWWLFTASLPLRGNSEGHVVQSEPAEHLMGLWCCTAECVLFNSIKMLLASRDIVNLPNKETPLPRCWSGIRTGNIFSFNLIYSEPSLHILCAGLKSSQPWRALGEPEVGVSFWGLSPCSPVPGQQQTGHCSQALLQLCPGTHSGGRAGSKVNDWHNLLAGITAEVWKNTPLLVHHGADNKAGNLGEHPKGNKGRLNVIFITDTFVWLEKVVTVQEAFSVFSQFSITKSINTKPKQPLLTKILLTYVHSPSLLQSVILQLAGMLQLIFKTSSDGSWG